LVKNLERLIYEISLKMRLLKAIQTINDESGLSEREVLLLELIGSQKGMSISDIGKYFPGLAISTISGDISQLWKKRELVTKGINPDNERARVIELSDKGYKLLNDVEKKQAERFSILLKGLNVKGENRKILEQIIQDALLFIEEKLASLNSSNSE
jgi:DNA-binding MarR family transcriptional regulator